MSDDRRITGNGNHGNIVGDGNTVNHNNYGTSQETLKKIHEWYTRKQQHRVIDPEYAEMRVMSLAIEVSKLFGLDYESAELWARDLVVSEEGGWTPGSGRDVRR